MKKIYQKTELREILEFESVRDISEAEKVGTVSADKDKYTGRYIMNTVTQKDKNETRITKTNGLYGASILHRTWFRDVNGNSYQSAALYLNGRIVKVWEKNYQGIRITEDAKQLQADGLQFADIMTATRLKDFYTVRDEAASLSLSDIVSLYA